jgi:predicted nucleic acid-binding protein
LRSRRDQHHAAADRAFRAAVERRIPLVTTNLVLAEVHRLTLFRAGREPALRAFELIDQSPSVTVHFATADDHNAGCEWMRRIGRPVTYTDAVSFAVMTALKCTHVVGFDDDFAAAGFELWRV